MWPVGWIWPMELSHLAHSIPGGAWISVVVWVVVALIPMVV